MSKNRAKKRAKKQKESQAWNPFGFLNKRINWFLALLLILPFIQSQKTIDPNISIRFLGQAIFLIAFLLYHYGIRRIPIIWNQTQLVNVLFLSLLAFFIWSGVLISIAISPTEALYEVTRTGLNFILLLLAFLTITEEKVNWSQFTLWMVILGIVHSLIGLDQYFGWEITSYRGTAAPFGIMTNRNLHGSFLALLLPFAIYHFLNKEHSYRLVSFIGIIVILIGVFYSQTRSAMLSSALSVVFSTIVVSVFFKQYRKSMIIIFLSMVVLSSMLYYNKTVQDGNKKRNRARVERVTKQNNSKASKASKGKNNKASQSKRPKITSIDERLVVWQETIQMIGNNPVTGVGLSNWKLNIPLYNIGGTRSEYGEIVRIRPHNLYLQQLSETGIPGFIFFFTPWILIIVFAFRIIIYDQDLRRRNLTLFILAILVGLACDSFFSFPSERIAHSVIQWFLMGLLIANYKLYKGETERERMNINWFIVGPSVLLSIWAIFLGNEKYQFENHMNQARAQYTKQRYDRAVEQVEKGKSKYVKLEINNDPIEIVAGLSLKALQKHEEALKELETAVSLNPYSTRIINTQGAVLTDMKRHEEAAKAFENALLYSPKHELSLRNLALNYYFLERYQDCLNTLKKIEGPTNDFTKRLKRSARAKLDDN